MKLGELIRKYRDENNISLRDFAEKCQLSHAYIDKLEKGFDPRSGKEVVPTIDTLQKIANGMNMSLEILLNEIGLIDDIHIPDDYAKKYKVTKRDLTQYEDFIQHANIFFMNDEVSDEDKEALFRDISELFWKSKEKNKQRYGRKKNTEDNE